MKQQLFIYSILLVFIIACNIDVSNPDTDEVLARVHDKQLYKSDLIDIVPEGVSGPDSVSIVKNYLNNWVRNELILQKAESNLLDSQKDFKKQLDNYRKSLIIYEYESNLIRQNLDTIVHDSEIEEYYEKNKQNFQLRDNIIIVHFVILDIDSIDNNPVAELLNSELAEDYDLLEEYCKKSAINYFLEDQWIYFNDLLSSVPIETYNPQAFLETTDYVEIEDLQSIYYVKFLDYKIKESESPLSLKKETIRSIIINKRKVELIKKMHSEVYENAFQNNEFEIF